MLLARVFFYRKLFNFVIVLYLNTRYILKIIFNSNLDLEQLCTLNSTVQCTAGTGLVSCMLLISTVLTSSGPLVLEKPLLR